jgi:hypothetical protein
VSRGERERGVSARPAPGKNPPVTFAVARRLALALPGVTEGTSYGTPSFKVEGKFFFRIREDGGSLAVRIDFDTRDALLQADPRAFFITDHYLGYPAICIRLANVGRAKLKSVLEESWRFVAPRRLTAVKRRAPTRAAE